MNRSTYSPPGNRFYSDEYRTKSYSQIWLYLLTIPTALILANLIIIPFVYPLLRATLGAGVWTIIGANILGVICALFISTGIPFVIRIENDAVTLIGFPYKYTIRREDVEDVIVHTSGFSIRPKPHIRYTFLLGCREYPGYKCIAIANLGKTYEAYIEIVKTFLPLISRTDIIWENVPEKYKPQVIELVNKWREMKGYDK